MDRYLKFLDNKYSAIHVQHDRMFLIYWQLIYSAQVHVQHGQVSLINVQLIILSYFFLFYWYFINFIGLPKSKVIRCSLYVNNIIYRMLQYVL